MTMPQGNVTLGYISSYRSKIKSWNTLMSNKLSKKLLLMSLEFQQDIKHAISLKCETIGISSFPTYEHVGFKKH